MNIANYVIRSYKKIKEILISLSRRSQIIVATMAGATLLSLGCFCALSLVASSLMTSTEAVAKAEMELEGCVDITKGHPITWVQVTQWEAAFAAAELEEYKILPGPRVFVPEDKKSIYIAELAKANALPKSFYERLAKSFGSTAIITVNKKYSAKEKLSKEKFCANFFNQYPRVEKALVTFGTVKEGHFAEKRIKTANIFIHPTNKAPLTSSEANKIRRSMTQLIAGLKIDNVTVTDMSTGMPFDSSTEDSEGNLCQKHTQAEEEKIRKWILAVLRGYPDVDVTVSCLLSAVSKSTLSKKGYGKSGFTVYGDKKEQSFKSEGQFLKQHPGFIPLSTTSGSSSPGPKMKVEANPSAERKLTPPTKEIRSNYAIYGFLPVEAKAIITLPYNYYVQLWKKANPAPTGEAATEPTPADLLPIQAEVANQIKNAIGPLLQTRNNADALLAAGDDVRNLVHVKSGPQIIEIAQLACPRSQ